jgi:flagellar basal-body rod protein FlgF
VSDGLTSSVAALGSAEKRLESIASNLANVSANGFKRTSTATRSFDAVLRGQAERQIASQRVIDYGQGTLRSTGEAYDLALFGSGFFAVEGRAGEMYTRDGRFLVNDTGVLQTLEGLPVAWEGPRGTIDPNGAAVTIDAHGAVHQGEAQVGKLRVVDFARLDRLQPLRGGFYRATREAVAAESQAEVRQGHLELANVAAVDELVALVTVQRQFEAGTRLLSTIDQSYRRLTSQR